LRIGHGFTRRGLKAATKSEALSAAGCKQIRNSKPAGWSPGWLAPLAPQIRITKTQDSKQTITSYFDSGYGSLIAISGKKQEVEGL